MLYSDANFSAPPLEKSAQCSCRYTTDIMSGKAGGVWVEIVSVSVLWKTISHIPRLGLHLVSFPDHLKKWKEGLHGVLSDTYVAGNYCKKNVVIAFDIWDLSILTA